MKTDSPGKRIRRARQARGWTQQKLADELEVHVSAVVTWEKGQHFPRRYQGKIEALLGIDLDDEAQQPKIPADLLAAVNRTIKDPVIRADVIGAIEQTLTGRPEDDGEPEVTLHGGLALPSRAPLRSGTDRELLAASTARRARELCSPREG